MKKFLIVLNKLVLLFENKKQYKVEICGPNMISIEIDYTEEDLQFVKNVLNDTLISDYEILLDTPTIDLNFNKINKCLIIIFSQLVK